MNEINQRNKGWIKILTRLLRRHPRVRVTFHLFNTHMSTLVPFLFVYMVVGPNYMCVTDLTLTLVFTFIYWVLCG